MTNNKISIRTLYLGLSIICLGVSLIAFFLIVADWRYYNSDSFLKEGKISAIYENGDDNLQFEILLDNDSLTSYIVDFYVPESIDTSIINSLYEGDFVRLEYINSNYRDESLKKVVFKEVISMLKEDEVLIDKKKYFAIRNKNFMYGFGFSAAFFIIGIVCVFIRYRKRKVIES